MFANLIISYFEYYKNWHKLKLIRSVDFFREAVSYRHAFTFCGGRRVSTLFTVYKRGTLRQDIIHDPERAMLVVKRNRPIKGLRNFPLWFMLFSALFLSF